MYGMGSSSLTSISSDSMDDLPPVDPNSITLEDNQFDGLPHPPSQANVFSEPPGFSSTQLEDGSSSVTGRALSSPTPEERVSKAPRLDASTNPAFAGTTSKRAVPTRETYTRQAKMKDAPKPPK